MPVGCSTTHYRKAADKETYSVISEKTPAVPNMDTEFTIESQDTEALLAGLPEGDPHEEFMGEPENPDQKAKIISLEKALELAVKKNRQYQTQKEVVYLSALQLTLERNQWTPIFSGRGGATYARTTRDETTLSDRARLAQEAPNFVRQVGQLTGTPGDLLNRYSRLVEGAATVTGLNQPDTDIVDERSVPARVQFGMTHLLAGGAQIAVDLTSNFLRFLTGDPRASATSALAAEIRKPLIRGAGRKVAQENLTQAERDVLYDLRDFALFRKDFAVDIAESYYRVLQARDAVRNNYLGYQALKEDAARWVALKEVGRATAMEVGLAQQAEYNAEGDWILSIQQYRQALDEFKIQLGLSTDAEVMLDPGELDRLMEQGLHHPDIPVEDAVEVALVTRLDLYTAKDEVDDAERKVYVAANALKPGLDITLAADVDSLDDNRFEQFDFRRARFSAALDLDPDFDRKPERNQYRAALISFERAGRQLELAQDNVKLQVREDWRALEEARRSFEIQTQSVALGERRVEEQTLRAQYGEVTARDKIEAQNDLINARNGLTRALVNHTIARLRFWRDMGILYIKPNGQWEEVTDADYPEPGTGDAGTGAATGEATAGTAPAGEPGREAEPAPAAS